MADNQRLSKWMEENKITTTELAGKLGVTHTAVSQIRSGKNQMSLKTLKLLLENYPDLCPRWLLLGEGKSHCESKEAGSIIHEHRNYIRMMEEYISAKEEIIGMLKDQIKEMKSCRISPQSIVGT